MKTPYTVLFREYLEGDESNVLAFKKAGDELVAFVERGEKYNWYEAFLRPIGFLYRHYLELELKYWLKKLKEKPLEQVGKLLKQHNLKKLWLELKPLIEPFCGNGDMELLSEVEEIVLTFDMYDQTGQEFRYTRTNTDIRTLRNIPTKVDLKDIKCSIARVSNFFNGLSGVIEG